MKSLIALAVLTLGLVGCGNNGAPEGNDSMESTFRDAQKQNGTQPPADAGARKAKPPTDGGAK